MYFHLKTFCAIILCCFICTTFGMQYQQQKNYFARVKICACLCSLRSYLEKLTLSSLKWAWDRKSDLVLITGRQAVQECFRSSESVQGTSLSSKTFSTGMKIYSYSMNAMDESDYYIKYRDQHSSGEHRCYFKSEQALFKQLYIGRPEVIDKKPQVFWDKRMFFCSLCQEVGGDIFYATLSKELPFKTFFNITSSETFMKRVILGAGNVLLRLGLQKAVIAPCMSFGMRIKLMGLMMALASLLPKSLVTH
jgi:hypothetical protein